MNGYQFFYLDFHTVSVHKDAITTSLNEAGTKLSLKVTVPSTFIGSERIAKEFRLSGPADICVAPYTETSDKILKEHPNPSAIMGPSQVVNLLFVQLSSIFTRKLSAMHRTIVLVTVFGQRISLCKSCPSFV